VCPWQELQSPVHRNTFLYVVLYGREISPCSALPSTVLAFGITGSNLIVGIGVCVCEEKLLASVFLSVSLYRNNPLLLDFCEISYLGVMLKCICAFRFR